MCGKFHNGSSEVDVEIKLKTIKYKIKATCWVEEFYDCEWGEYAIPEIYGREKKDTLIPYDLKMDHTEEITIKFSNNKTRLNGCLKYDSKTNICKLEIPNYSGNITKGTNLVELYFLKDQGIIFKYAHIILIDKGHEMSDDDEYVSNTFM
jgi:hypothetical protein